LHGAAQPHLVLSDWPLPQPASWLQYVNQPQTEAELIAIRRSVKRGQPYGGDRWVRATAERLGLQSTLRERGRPAKQEPPLPLRN
jgi:putative transposase